jgi:hypothetical protein
MKLYRLAFLALLIPWHCFDSFAWSPPIDAPVTAPIAR